MDAVYNQINREKIEEYKAILGMPYIDSYLKELFEAKIDTLEAMVYINNILE